MNFFKRSWLYLTAKVGKTAILMLVFTAIMVFVLAGLTIRQAAIKATENAKKEVGASVTLSVDRDKMMKKALETASADGSPVRIKETPVPLSQAEKVSKMSDVKNYSFSTSASAAAGTGMTPITGSADTSSNDSAQGQGHLSGKMGEEIDTSKSTVAMNPDFRLTGVNNLLSLPTFQDGTAKITSGRAITEKDKGTNHVAIESQLATANQLKVGSTFKLKDENGTERDLTIVGIYETSQVADGMAQRMRSLNPANTIYSYYTLTNSFKEGATDTSEQTIDSAVYYLKDPAKMEKFVASASKKLDTDTMTLSANDQAYQQMLTPLNNVASFATNIVVLVAVAGVIILSLIVILSIRERRFEIGVLMSLGENKAKIIGQFFIELFVIMLVSVSLAGLTGNIIGNVIGNQLLNQQNTTQQEQAQNTTTPQGGGGFMGDLGGPFTPSKQEAKQIERMNVKMTPKTIYLLGALALGIVLIAIFVASIGILRLEPKTILTTN
ncbi:ABC transporter permease [Pseudolactococcus yaeyamensis]